MPQLRRILRKLISSPAIQFKGNGFYITDYAKKNIPDKEGKPKDKPKAGKSGETKAGAPSRRKPTKKPVRQTLLGLEGGRRAMKIVVRTPNWIGDVIFALPALESLKANYPEAEIWLAADAWVQGIFAGDEYAEPHHSSAGPVEQWQGLAGGRPNDLKARVSISACS